MRRLHLHPSFILLSLSALLVMGGLVVYAYQLNSQQTAKKPLIPTRQIGQSTAIGGQPQATTQQNNQQSDSSSSSQPGQAPTVQPTKPSTSNTTPSSPPPTKSMAPKQDEITASVKNELPYSALSVTPNDPYYTSSWAMQRTNALSAWAISTGTTVTIAVIDTGFALQHEDLASQWAVNAGEQGTTKVGDTCWTGTSQDKATNSCDDDSNGYVDDWRGWNFVSKNNNPQAGTTTTNGTEAISHGTSVAGLAGAATNNSKGVASYNWNTKLMPLQTLDDSGNGTTSGIVSAIYYAVDNGAQVINLSFGGPDQDPVVQAAVDYAYSKNVVVVAAAGNCGTAGDAGCGGLPAPRMMYPALCNHVIAVGATDANNARASFSSYGDGLDVMAPGSGTIISPLINTLSTPNNYTTAYSGSLYGTSFASPIVSSIAALTLTLRPSISVDDITAIINGSASKVTGMNGQVYTSGYGHGVVSAGTAAIIADSLSKTSPASPALAQTGDSHSEHSYTKTATMSSGCQVAANSYCTVRMMNTGNGYDRYLPYTKTNATGQVGWQWTGGILGSGEWSLTAVQGTTSSSNYVLFAK